MPRISTQQRRRELTAIAVQLIVEEGPASVTARKVADRAGVPLGTVHYAFRDMEELIGLANIEVLGSIFRAIEDVPTDRGLRAWIAESLEAYWRFLRDQPREGLAFFETYVTLFRSGHAKTAVLDAQKFLISRMREAEAADGRKSRTPLPDLLHLLMMASDGIALIHFGRRDNQQTPKDVQRIIRAFHAMI